jgi:DNA-binding CsgD family transcriptional regulator
LPKNRQSAGGQYVGVVASGAMYPPGESGLAAGSGLPPAAPPAGRGCQACGAVPSGGPEAAGLVLRAAIPQPIAAALRLTHLLSARERTVFQLLGAGYDNRSIARELKVSERTVKRHVTVILAKLRLESRLQAGLAALLVSSSFPDGAR